MTQANPPFVREDPATGTLGKKPIWAGIELPKKRQAVARGLPTLVHFAMLLLGPIGPLFEFAVGVDADS